MRKTQKTPAASSPPSSIKRKAVGKAVATPAKTPKVVLNMLLAEMSPVTENWKGSGHPPHSLYWEDAAAHALALMEFDVDQIKDNLLPVRGENQRECYLC